MSDIAICARAAYKIYKVLEEAPGACADFRKEILWLYKLLNRVRITVEEMDFGQPEMRQPVRAVELVDVDKETLRALIKDCKKFLVLDVIENAFPKPVGAGNPTTCLDGGNHEMDEFTQLFDEGEAFRQNIGRSIRQAKFYRKIPKLRARMQDCIARLTSFSIQIIQYVDPLTSFL